MNTTVHKNNLVPSPPISAERGLRTFSKWDEVTSHGYGTRNYWLYNGVGISKKEPPTAHCSADGQFLPLFHRKQTRLLAEPQRSRRLLISRFIHKPEVVGLKSHETGDITQWHQSALFGSLKDLVYKSFNYKYSLKGVSTPLRWPRQTFRVDDFYVRAGDFTNWFVLDVDNHDPSAESTNAHLMLVKRLVSLMPALVRVLGGGSVFYAYRQDSPQGIHIWVTLHGLPRITKNLHERVRDFLKSHSDPELDRELDRRGLRKMQATEILPTEGHLIRLFGSCYRRVFTTTELKPKAGWFDAEALYRHISAKVTDGDPYHRYADLALAFCQADPLPDSPSSAPMTACLTDVLVTRPDRKGNYFASLVDSALNGVREGDILFESYLSLLSRALFYRDFHDHPNQRHLVVSTVMDWIERKHNGMVTRVNKGNRRNLVAVCHHIVRHMHETPPAIQDYWVKVRENDAKYPNQRISLVACMKAELKTPFSVTKETLKQVNGLLEGMGGSQVEEVGKGYTYNSKVNPLPPSSPSSPSPPPPLPPLVEARLRDHMTHIKGLRKKTYERIIKLACGLLNEIGLEGERRIQWKRINQLAGLGRGRRLTDRYKKILVGAEILKSWKYSGRPKVKATLYRLTEWVIREMKEAGY